METVEIRRITGHAWYQGRGETLQAALLDAARAAGLTGYTVAHIERFPGGDTLHVQFGHSVRNGGLSLDGKWVAHRNA